MKFRGENKDDTGGKGGKKTFNSWWTPGRWGKTEE